MNVSDGTVGDSFSAFTGSEVNISGGTVGDSFGSFEDAVVNISGGIVGNASLAATGSVPSKAGVSIWARWSVMQLSCKWLQFLRWFDYNL